MVAILLLFIGSLSLSEDHDIHIGVCDIKIEETSVNVTIKTFIDDLQIAVGLEPGKPLPEDYTSAEELIAEYIGSIIQLRLDGQLIELELEDLSSSAGDAVWITLEGKLTSPLTDKMECGFELLTDVYDDQTNLLNVYHKDFKDIYSLNTKKISFTYEPE